MHYIEIDYVGRVSTRLKKQTTKDQYKITIRLPTESDFASNKIEHLCKLINDAYQKAEEGIISSQSKRIFPENLSELLRTQSLLLAEKNNIIVGCIEVKIVEEGIGQFSMVVSDENLRGRGIGGQLIKAAENWALERGCHTMSLCLLTPSEWKQPHKEFLKAWYERLGYQPQFKQEFDDVSILITPCDFTVYYKALK